MSFAPLQREIHRGKCFETNTYDAANSAMGISELLADGGTRTQRNRKLISRHEHADAVRRLPSVRILKFFGGRLHWEQMDQGVARSTVGNVFEANTYDAANLPLGIPGRGEC